MSKVRSVVFVECNPFGSRLHVLGAMVQAARSADASVLILHPSRAPDAHWLEWKGALPNTVELREVDLGGAALTRPTPLDRRGLRALLEMAAATVRNDDAGVLTALDDSMRQIWFALGPYKRFARRSRKTFIVKYRVEDVFARRRSLRSWLVKIATRTIVRVANAELVIFDERFVGHSSVHVFPDPWEGSFGDRSAPEARAKLGMSFTGPIVGLIGRQDSRKGFATAVDGFAALGDTVANVGCMILGKVAPAETVALERLRLILGDNLWHFADFVADRDLPDFFAACDMVWLPYSQDFTGSSGVLVRAAASGTPVVASAHGLVGYRVRRHQLGMTFPAGDSKALALAATSLLRSPQEAYDSEKARQWADDCSVDSLVKRAAIVFTT